MTSGEVGTERTMLEGLKSRVLAIHRGGPKKKHAGHTEQTERFRDQTRTEKTTDIISKEENINYMNIKRRMRGGGAKNENQRASRKGNSSTDRRASASANKVRLEGKYGKMGSPAPKKRGAE